MTNVYLLRREVIEMEEKRRGEGVTTWWTGFLYGVLITLCVVFAGCAVSHEQKTTATAPAWAGGKK